jgi:hypothetical protein
MFIHHASFSLEFHLLDGFLVLSYFCGNSIHYANKQIAEQY